jgi:asparagine synthase (glutamine-hydrolysing)
VCAIAQRHSDKPIQTFTLGSSGGNDERPFARRVADHIGSKHHEHLVTPDIVKQLPHLVRYLDQPLFDNSTLPTYLVSEQASARVKVVLSGDGGDEPFGGYDWTRFALILPDFSLKWQPRGWQWAYRKGPIGLSQRLVFDLTNTENKRYHRRVTVSEVLRAWLYRPEFLRQIGDTVSLSTENFLNRAPVGDERDKFVYVDLCRYLPEDVLYKVDRMSMANSLEVRVPLLDHRLLEWILRLPFGMRFRHGRGKYLLRKLAERYLPPDVIKPRKQGFTVPLGRWLHGKLNNWVEDLFHTPSFEQRGIVRPQAALEMLAMHHSKRYELGHRIWSLVILEVWARLWLDRRNPDEVLLCQ